MDRPFIYYLNVIILIMQDDIPLVLPTATGAEYLNPFIITYSQQWQILDHM